MDIPGYAQSPPRQTGDGRRVARVSQQRTDGEWTGEAHCETHQRETRPMRRARTHERLVDEEQGTASRETERGKSEGGGGDRHWHAWPPAIEDEATNPVAWFWRTLGLP